MNVLGNIPTSNGPQTVGEVVDPKTVGIDGLPSTKPGPVGSPGIKRFLEIGRTENYHEYTILSIN